ncbi:PREDICTED: cactin-like, partial [Rhagoletis zephyria]|uniref:cactin-like n=1 Tax=Rhagoletis zephyria TaxID=28612 RepID=UPI0008118F8A
MVAKMLQLNELRTKIENKTISRSDAVDISYWESLLSQLKAHMARARLRDKHHENLRKKLNILKTKDDAERSDATSTSNNEKEFKNEFNLLQRYFDMYEDGKHSPTYVQNLDDENALPTITEEDSFSAIERLRAKATERSSNTEHFTEEESHMRNTMRRKMDKDDAELSVEVPLEIVQIAADKYRPGKPRYLNRVHTGFEWNKYDQTYYDMDNPPPKIVQGYKFNIFYPDLIGKNTTRQHFLVSTQTPSGIYLFVYLMSKVIYGTDIMKNYKQY